MKKTLPFLQLIILPLIFFYACNTGGSGEKYTIKMRLDKGDTFRQDMKMNMLINSAGMEMNMKMDAGVSFDVTNTSAEEKDVKITYTKMHMTMDMGKLNMNMPDSIMNKSSGFIVGKSVMLKLSKDNVITDVKGFEEILNNQVHDSASQEMMKKMFSKDQFNSMFGMMFSMYPKKPVQVGESWTQVSSLKMANMDMKVDNKFTLLSVKNGLAEIGINSTLSGSGDMMKESAGMKMDLSGIQKGTITIRMDNGYLHTGSYKMDMKAEMQMMGQKIPMSMKADYDMKGD